MARILDRPLSDGSSWKIKLSSTNLSTCPPEGLVKLDLNMKYTLLTVNSKDEHGNPNPRQSKEYFQFNFPTLRLLSTLNRTQYSSALHLWLRQLLQGDDVVNDITDHVIEHVFETLPDDEIFAVHVQIDLNHVSTVHADQDPVDEIQEEEETTGLSEVLIMLLMLMNKFPPPAKEELECKGLRDCSICLGDLVSGGGEEEENTNCLFKSRQCGHIFHGECMKKWLRISDSCPLCRLVLSSESKRILEEILSSYRLEQSAS